MESIVVVLFTDSFLCCPVHDCKRKVRRKVYKRIFLAI